MLDFSFVIPVFHGENTISLLVTEIDKVLKNTRFSHEIIFVEDKASDNSWEIIEQLCKENSHIKGIQLAINVGQHNALICGFSQTNGNYIITLDEDLQHDPTDFLTLYKKLIKENLDIVYGYYEESKHNFFRNFNSKMMRWVISKSIPNLHKQYSPFRIIKREIALQTIEMQNSYTFVDGYFSWLTTYVGSTKINHHQRIKGKSSYNLAKLITHSLNIFFTFSDLPIRFLTSISLFVFLITSSYSSYIIVRKLMLNDLQAGFPSLIISIGFGTSLILLGLAILGKYIHRINLKTTKRPNFNIRQKI